MEEVLFLFLYHQLNPVTQRHWTRLAELHGRDQVIPLAYQYQGAEIIPGTVDVALDWDYGWPIRSIWHEADKVMLRWFHRPGRPVARRYVFFEYDILANAPAKSFYGNSWNADVAAVCVQTPEHSPMWPWWHQSSLLGASFPYRAGVTPLAATLWSDEALGQIARSRLLQDCYCELRMATLAQQFGFQLQVIDNASRTVSWRAEDIRVTQEPSWFHPVKS